MRSGSREEGMVVLMAQRHCSGICGGRMENIGRRGSSKTDPLTPCAAKRHVTLGQ